MQKDLLVFYHIQKTSGISFDKSILEGLLIYDTSDLSWKKACFSKMFPVEKRRDGKTVYQNSFLCDRDGLDNVNNSWYLSWNVVGWGWPCGLHPDLSDFQTCIKNRLKIALTIIHVSFT
jgi:hypothetical protein